MVALTIDPNTFSFQSGKSVLWLLLVAAFTIFWAGGWLEKHIQKNYIYREESVRAAAYWKRADHGVLCMLCPRRCFIPEGGRGWCRVRVNAMQKLYTQVYGLPAAVHVDPIEKKPVFHLLPGSRAFSIATAGCNLNCQFCQNWTLATSNPETLPAEFLSPHKIVAMALRTGSRSIAYTYSEPVVFYEYMREIAELAHRAGLYNVMITGGYIAEKPLRELLPLLDVIKVDLKGFEPSFYRHLVKGELHYVKRTLKIIAEVGTQLEVVNLLIPTQNDSEASIRALCEWVAHDLGKATPLFFSRFTPQYRMQNLPVTPQETLHRARVIARDAGLQYIYLGNVMDPEGENTICPNCDLVLVDRHGYAILENRLVRRNTCPRCGERIPGIWQDKRLGL
ncbi:AmmeMemoRadiSam system radical SAM enzyme [bacterium]|nr:AmmeMemoRadiSam system radical SAM enzyme [bacterium]